MRLPAATVGVCILASALTVAAEMPSQNRDIDAVKSDSIEPVQARELNGNKQPAEPNQNQQRRRRQSDGGTTPRLPERSRSAQPNSPQPGRANSLDSYQAKPVDPYHSREIDSVKSQPAQPVQSEPVQPVPGTGLQGDVQKGQDGRTHRGWHGLPERRDARPSEAKEERQHDRDHRSGYEIDRQHRQQSDQMERQADERARREAYERERRQREHDTYEREHHGYDERRTGVIDGANPRRGSRSNERQREYIVDAQGRRIYIERDRSGRCTRRYIVVDGHDYDVDSHGRIIYLDRGMWSIEHRYVEENGKRYEYDIDANGREMIVERDRWGRVKQRQLYAEQPHGTIETDRAEEVEPYQAEDVQPYRAQDVQPYRADKVAPYQAQGLRTDRADDIEPYYADQSRTSPRREIGPDPRRYPTRTTGTGSVFMHTFGLAVPGVAYSYDNYATNTRTTVTSAGTVTKSAVRINPDHTYVWNSAWDGRLIRGRWTEHDGGIRLLQAQEGKDWLMSVLTPASGKATIVLYTDSVQYHGTPLD